MNILTSTTLAEDADFFDAATKKQLQAMLTEMWKATLQLKTYKPAAALPFAYNALRLLKDLQQKTRAYVAKTGLQTTPLNMDKRLTGDQDKIGEPINKTEVRQKRFFVAHVTQSHWCFGESKKRRTASEK